MQPIERANQWSMTTAWRYLEANKDGRLAANMIIGRLCAVAVS